MSETTLVDVTLADVSEGIAEAQVVEWLVAIGQAVSEDEPIIVISTDKAVVELPAPASGILREQTVPAGATVSVGSLLARIEATREAAAKLIPGTARSSPSSAPQPSIITPVTIAAPSTRLLARQLNVDLAALSGSGPGGRILADDVRQVASRNSGNTSSGQKSQQGPASAQADEKRVPLRGVRLAVARSTASSWRDVPHIVEFRRIDATKLQQAREANRSHSEHEGPGLTFLPFFVKAAAVALLEHPNFNARLDMDNQEIIYYRHCNIGIATATEAGLTIPVLGNVEHQSLMEIAQGLDTLIDRAKTQKLSVAETTKGTFTITNFGSYGTWLGTPIIRAPEVAIVGFGRIQDAVLAVDGAPVVRPVLPICAATDHRLNDGIHLAAFLDTLTKSLLDPSIFLPEIKGRSH
jgi:pyruvate dehydrogenase E2 component (dihydrolipoamide acetyltransferase)